MRLARRDLSKSLLAWLALACSNVGAPPPSQQGHPTPAVSAAKADDPNLDDPNLEAEPALPDEPVVAHDSEELVEDDSEDAAHDEGGPEQPTHPHPLDGWSSDRVRQAVRQDVRALGSISIGLPNAGALLNGQRAEAGALFQTVDPAHAWGTEETLGYLSAAIRQVHERFPETAPLSLGHISAERGGPLRPHVSHQSGRDVDISFYYRSGARWYLRANENNLDLPRTWALVRALVHETDVEMILIDRAVQTIIRRYALSAGEDAEWVDGLFQGKGALRPLVRHAPGHATHIHVRFYNPIAQETARRTQAALVAEGTLPELVSYVRHKARRGDTLAKISKKYGVSVNAIKGANGLRSSRIREQRVYRIPVRAGVPVARGAPLRFPARRRAPRAVAPLEEREARTPAARSPR